MKLTKSLIWFDLETTGIDIKKDRIIEIFMLKKNPDETEETYYKLINPDGVEIREDAKKAHGIEESDLEDCPKFSEVADEIFEFVKDSDFGGYNIQNFDLELLTQELMRAGKKFNPITPKIVDVYQILLAKEPRKLEAIYKRFTGKDLTNAHSAEADVRATMEIFEKQLEVFELPESVEEIHKDTFQSDGRVDYAGKFKRTDTGDVIITFGKHKGKSVTEVAKIDSGYFDWMAGADFPLQTRTIAKKLSMKLSS